MSRFTVWTPWILGLLRLVTGLLFLEHGTQKLLAFPAGDHSGVTLLSLMGLAGALELATGALVAAGFLTRTAALIASGEMAVAYWMAHAPQSAFPVNNGGDAAILYCFVFLYLVFAGPGRLAVDNGFSRRRRAV